MNQTIIEKAKQTYQSLKKNKYNSLKNKTEDEFGGHQATSNSSFAHHGNLRNSGIPSHPSFAPNGERIETAGPYSKSLNPQTSNIRQMMNAMNH